LNYVGILVSLFVPWLLFCFVSFVLTFRIHYWQPGICCILVSLAFLLGVVLPGVFAAKQVKKKFTDPQYLPTWYLYIAATCLVAFLLGAADGEYTYGHFMQPYYDFLNLAVYTDLDTNEFVGQQLMDAGRINFKNGTMLELSHSMGFRNTDMFCVAPIVTKNSPFKENSHDFWAVGKNCCSGAQADFHCKGFSDPHSTGALRLINHWDRPFYRLAVQQAEATYKISATHPLFFEWVHNADTAMDSYARNGYTSFITGVCANFLLQAFLTGAATLAFSKLVHA
jgi:hypothetical protein